MVAGRDSSTPHSGSGTPDIGDQAAAAARLAFVAAAANRIAPRWPCRGLAPSMETPAWSVQRSAVSVTLMATSAWINAGWCKCGLWVNLLPRPIWPGRRNGVPPDGARIASRVAVMDRCSYRRARGSTKLISFHERLARRLASSRVIIGSCREKASSPPSTYGPRWNSHSRYWRKVSGL